MSVHEYIKARNQALKTMTLGLFFLVFLPLGIPLSLIIIPFIAGRNGAKDLDSNWHLTYILTVGGGWSLGLVVSLIALLSIALGPALRINLVEIAIFILLIIFTWGSFTIGVKSSNSPKTNYDRPYEDEWEKEEKIEQETIEQKQPEINKTKSDSDLRKMAITAEPNEIKTEKKQNKTNNFIPGKKKRGKTRLKLK
ncbi:MAG: hypothetical protein CMB30_03365 [Euryarchaeota archaeon]|nr:hypothetical protein [Euryarchaeota archaeon]